MNALRQNGFLLALCLAVGLAFVAPEIGARDGPLHSEALGKAGVFLIFLMQGLSLKTREMLSRLANVKAHLFCQAWIFLAAPLFVLAVTSLLGELLSPAARFGLLYLAVLPTTVSTAVIFTTVGGGDPSTALFNTTLSNAVGVFATPLWCIALFASAETSFPPVGSLLAKLALLVLLPVFIGQVVRPFAREVVAAIQPAFKPLSNGIILFIVYAAFCNSMADRVWSAVGWNAAVQAGLGALALLAAMSWFAWKAAAWAAADRAQRVALFFCASQKTLAAGTSMAVVIFAADNGLPADLHPSLVILPLLCYHPMQLFLGGVLAPRLGKRGAAL